MITQLLLSAAGGYSPQGVTFGATDYMKKTSDLTGNADSKVGTFSAWVKFNGTDGDDERTIFASEYTSLGNIFNVLLRRGSNNRLYFSLRSTGALIFNSSTTTKEILASDGWTHILLSWNLATGAAKCYVDDVEAALTISTNTNANIDYTVGLHTSGTIEDGAATDFLNADVADFWFSFAEYIDLSVEANRRKFIDQTVNPVLLGDNGELPTGSSPIMFFTVAEDEAASDYLTNKGTGGNFIMGSGTLSLSATSPSD